MFGDVVDRLDALRSQGIFVVEDFEGLQFARQDDRLFGTQVAVDFEAQVDAVADRLAHRPHHVDRRSDDLGRRLFLEAGEEGDHPEREKALFDALAGACGSLLDGIPSDILE